jgi:hypothetical protein
MAFDINNPTFKSFDLSNATDWPTINGSPAFATDQWGGQKALADGVNDDGESDASYLTNGHTKVTHSSWIKRDAIASRTEYYWAHQAGADQNGFRVGWLVGFLYVELNQTPGNKVISIVKEADLPLGEMFHVGAACQATTGGDANINVLINGVEPTYHLQNLKVGTGYTSFDGTGEARWGLAPGEGRFTGDIARLQLWSNEFASNSELLDLYNAEVAAIGSGGIKGGEGRPNFRLDFHRSTRYNRESPRFNR